MLETQYYILNIHKIESKFLSERKYNLKRVIIKYNKLKNLYLLN